MSKPRIILLDVETSLMKVTTFSLWNDHLSHEAIVEDWFMLSWAWKQLGEKTVHAKSVLDFKRKSLQDDYGLVKSIREELDDVDVIIGHNLSKFDVKKLNARLIFHSLPPLPLITQIDTLKEAKKIAQFTSNRLDYLSKHLIGKGKEKTTPQLWERCMAGDASAMKEMIKYNKIDVVRLEEVYNRFKPYMKSHSHIGALMGKGKHSCNKCGSVTFNSSGNKIRYTATGINKLQRQCKNCGSYSTFTINKNEK